MKIAYFGNNRLGLDVLRFLVDGHAEVVVLGVHPAERARYRAELVELSGLPDDSVFEGPQLRDEATLDCIRASGAELGVSVMYGYLFREPLIRSFARGMVNLHPSLLPWNRGVHTNVWSIVERTPAGVTLHRIDPGLDTGAIIAQREVAIEPVDTGATLHRRLEAEAAALFREAWPRLLADDVDATPQAPGGSFHRTADLQPLQRIDLDATTTARDLLNVIRACTFRPYDSAFFEEGGRKVFVRVSLEYGDEQ